MKTKANKTGWAVLALALGAGLGLLVLTLPGGQARAGEPGGERALQGASGQPVMVGAPSMFAAPPLSDGGGLDLSGSGVATTDCYQADRTQTFCFTVYNGSTDGEWIDIVRLNFPEDTMIPLPAWTANASAYEDPTDSVGYAVNFTHTISGKQIEYQSSDTDGFGEISNGASWMVCVDVYVPSGYDGDRYVWWDLVGDATPAPDTESGQAKMEKCTPLTLIPSQVVITGCNGTAQSLEFELTNYGAGNNTTVNFVYDAPDADFTGPTDVQMSEGEVMTFTIQFEPKLCLEAGETVTGTLAVVGGGYADESFVTQSIAETDGWRRRADSDIPTMDNVVVWASHRDSGLWSIGGYGSDGAVQRYDPVSNTWQKGFESEAVITPLIEYPVDGCYGLDGSDPDTAHEIVVLFPDTLVTDSLHVYDITADSWYTRPIPGFFPGNYIGHWGFDVVSLLNNPVVRPGIADRNMCYLSGGNNEKPGGGSTRNLWRYDPEANGGQYIGNFVDSTVVFGFHASWYVPWIGDDGAICVAGGADHNHQIHNSTRCYDIGANTFNAANADLGTLPEPWWGMADGWRITEYGYELWIANGVAQDGTLLPASAYFREGMTDFAYGPPIPHGLYRLEGDGWNNQFFTLNGSRGGFWYSEFSLRLASCPICHQVDLPLVLRNH